MNDGAVLLRLHSSAAQRECRRKLNIFIPHPAGGRSPSSHGFWGVIIYSDIGPLAAGGDHRPPFFLVGNNNLLIRKLLIPFFRPNHPFDVSQTGSNFIIIPFVVDGRVDGMVPGTIAATTIQINLSIFVAIFGVSLQKYPLFVYFRSIL